MGSAQLLLVFVDESFQTIAGKKVGALGAVAIPTEHYNRFCAYVFKAKRERLGATELLEAELKATDFFSKSVFRDRDRGGRAGQRLVTIDDALRVLGELGGVTFAVWTDKPEVLSLRASDMHKLTEPYIALLTRVMGYVESRQGDGRALLFFDQLGHQQDRRAACSIQNYLVRTDGRNRLRKSFIQIPHFTHSVVSPGLQMADLMAYLAARQAHPVERPELGEYWTKFAALAQYGVGGRKIVRTAGSTRAKLKPERGP